MTTELWATLIGGIVLLLTNSAAAIKLWGEVQRQKVARASTAVQRDKAEQELRELIQKTSWECQRNKEDILFTKTHLDDHQLQLSTLNTELAKLGTKMDTVLDAIKELKE